MKIIESTAAGLSPFMMRDNNLTQDECVEMIKKSIERITDPLISKLEHIKDTWVMSLTEIKKIETLLSNYK